MLLKNPVWAEIFIFLKEVHCVFQHPRERMLFWLSIFIFPLRIYNVRGSHKPAVFPVKHHDIQINIKISMSYFFDDQNKLVTIVQAKMF
jgi:hypothetical protein